MELTQKQSEGLETAIFRYEHNLGYTVIAGYAGSGKTTLVKFIIDAIAPDAKDVVYCAFTGKACKVLQQKGNKNVLTLHKLLYKFITKADGTFIKVKRETLDYKFIIVDECSMMNQAMVDTLLSYRDTYVIFLGDPFQLPPVKGEENNLLVTPHVFLDEIMRQALENEIIKFSMDIRLGNPLPTSYRGKDVQIYPKEELSQGMLDWADQVICATNATRASINNTMRAAQGLEGPPQIGDKVICLKNNWELYDSDSNALVNGTIGYIENITEGYFRLPAMIRAEENKLPHYKMRIQTEELTNFQTLVVDKKLFVSDQPYLDNRQRFQLSKNKNCKAKGIVPPEHFAFAYAITCHKAQGSQWDKVLIIEERFPFDKTEHARWLYTAITRAADKVVLIK